MSDSAATVERLLLCCHDCVWFSTRRIKKSKPVSFSGQLSKLYKVIVVQQHIQGTTGPGQQSLARVAPSHHPFSQHALQQHGNLLLLLAPRPLLHGLLLFAQTALHALAAGVLSHSRL
jgi:hypothetical protein